MPLIKKFATIVSVDYNLSEVSVGEQVQFLHDKNNEYDKNAINAFRSSTKEKIGYMSASPHTTLAGCETNKLLIAYIPSETVPLIGTVLEKKQISMKNGTISTALKVELFVVSNDKAV